MGDVWGVGPAGQAVRDHVQLARDVGRGEGKHEGLDLALHQPGVWYGHHVLFAQHTYEWFVIYG